MAITFVGGAAGGRAGSTSATTINYADLNSGAGLAGGSDTTPQAGDLVIISVGVGAAADRDPSCAISTPTGFTNWGHQFSNGTGQETASDAQYKFMGGTPDTSFDLPSTGATTDAQTYGVLVFRGVDAAVDDVPSTTATGVDTTRCDPATITPSTSGAWPVILGHGAAGTGSVYTAPANYSTNFQTAAQADNNDSQVGVGYRSDWTSGAEDPATYGGGGNGAGHSWTCRTVVLKPASGAADSYSGRGVGRGIGRGIYR